MILPDFNSFLEDIMFQFARMDESNSCWLALMLFSFPVRYSCLLRSASLLVIPVEILSFKKFWDSSKGVLMNILPTAK